MGVRLAAILQSADSGTNACCILPVSGILRHNPFLHERVYSHQYVGITARARALAKGILANFIYLFGTLLARDFAGNVARRLEKSIG